MATELALRGWTSYIITINTGNSADNPLPNQLFTCAVQNLVYQSRPSLAFLEIEEKWSSSIDYFTT